MNINQIITLLVQTLLTSQPLPIIISAPMPQFIQQAPQQPFREAFLKELFLNAHFLNEFFIKEAFLKEVFQVN